MHQSSIFIDTKYVAIAIKKHVRSKFWLVQNFKPSKKQKKEVKLIIKLRLISKLNIYLATINLINFKLRILYRGRLVI